LFDPHRDILSIPAGFTDLAGRHLCARVMATASFSMLAALFFMTGINMSGWQASVSCEPVILFDLRTKMTGSPGKTCVICY